MPLNKEGERKWVSSLHFEKSASGIISFQFSKKFVFMHVFCLNLSVLIFFVLIFFVLIWLKFRTGKLLAYIGESEKMITEKEILKKKKITKEKEWLKKWSQRKDI